MNSVDVWLCAACGAAAVLTRIEKRQDPETTQAVAIIGASLLAGIGARALRNAGYVETSTIYLLNPAMDFMIGWWALAAHRRRPREWTRLLYLLSFAAIMASAAYGAAHKTPGTRYVYAVALNALLVAGLCGVSWGGLRDGLADLGAWARRGPLSRRLPAGGRR
jgi:hypothetical protein